MTLARTIGLDFAELAAMDVKGIAEVFRSDLEADEGTEPVTPAA